MSHSLRRYRLSLVSSTVWPTHSRFPSAARSDGRLASAWGWLLLLLLLSGVLLSAGVQAGGEHDHVELTPERVLNQTAIPVYGYRVVHTYPHDRTSYTEGLVMLNGTFYEGTGLYGQSKVRQWEPASGRILHEASLDSRYFGEGVTVLDGRVYQLTYLENTGYLYDQATLERHGGFRYVTQGWGLTTDGRHLIMSDGSSAIQFLDPKSEQQVRRIFVTDAVGPVGFLNELEYADGKLYANVWQTNFIAVIAPATGKIAAWIDLTGINPEPAVLVYPLVLNGIAYNPATKRLLVTGKCWPNIYEIALTERKNR
ncbi:glutaminyl-peptide cyclotransferase [uncultured Thiodictyon sp.]|uniref:glutaminyl-peptide cyclotransferase n=1 Tax=uncultured Thiodictyon sp. TaxID=1846217 RepID=UPI0025FFB108|nr:glutaminyl-peptide cyclotransferase [uncultured Thiodictyon sp.]